MKSDGLHIDLSAGPSAEVVVTVAGGLDATTADLLLERLVSARGLIAGPSAVVVDLTGVRTMDAAGVATLLSASSDCERLGVPLRVVAPDNRPASRMLKACGATGTLHVVATAHPFAERVTSRAIVDHTVEVLMDDLGLSEARARARLSGLARRAGVQVGDGSLEAVPDLPVQHTGGAPSAGRAEARTASRKLRIDLVAASWEIEPPDFKAHLTDLSAALSRLGHEVTLHIRRDSAELPEFARTRRGYGLARITAGPPIRLSENAILPCLDEFAALLDHRWMNRVPDVVHLHSWMSGLAVRECAAPLVQSFHGLKIAERHGLRAVESAHDPAGGGRTDLERLMALSADRVIVVSGEEKAGLIRGGIPRAKMALVPWGVDTGRFSPDGPVAARGTAPRVLMLGSVMPHRGFHTAIEALAGVPDAELMIVGPCDAPSLRDDPQVVRLVRHAIKHKVADRTRFLGRVAYRDLPALLRSADVAVCVPRYEPSGISTLQAMACGVPVVASAVGALTDIVVDGLTGGLVPPRAPVALGRALRRLLGDPTRREIYSALGVDRVRNRYSWDRVAGEVVDAYHSATAAPSRTSTAERRQVARAEDDRPPSALPEGGTAPGWPRSRVDGRRAEEGRA